MTVALPRLVRRAMPVCAAGLLALAGTRARAGGQPATAAASKASEPDGRLPFWGEHQGGIATLRQRHTYFATFDLLTSRRDEVVKLLKAWTEAAARLSAGDTAQPLSGGLRLAVRPSAPKTQDPDEEYGAPDPGDMAADTGDALGVPPMHLTLTFGFGSGLFVKEGKDRFGLASRRPAGLVDMPKFEGDQLEEMRTGGDLSVQACADDPQVAFHAVRQLARIGEGVAQIRWVQTGYWPAGHRHLFGFAAESMGVPPDDPDAMAEAVWVGSEGPDWLRGGSYVVVRRIRFAIEHWDHMPVAFQEKGIGEPKFHGTHSHNVQTDSAAGDAQSHPKSHLRIVGPGSDTMLRRSYSYNDGISFVAERWPPWRQGREYDAGMLFICYQRDPRTGFIRTFGMMAKQDFVLNQFWTHTGGGLFACPRGAREGEYVGQALFEKSP